MGRKAQSLNINKIPFVQGNFLYVFIPAFVGLNIGWYFLQQRYVPESDRHDHPVIRLYKFIRSYATK